MGPENNYRKKEEQLCPSCEKKDDSILKRWKTGKCKDKYPRIMARISVGIIERK